MELPNKKAKTVQEKQDKVDVLVMTNVPGVWEGLQALERKDVNLVKYSDAEHDGKELNFPVCVADPTLFAKRIEHFPSSTFKWLQSTWAGVDAFLKPIPVKDRRKDYTLTRLGGVFGPLMSEFLIAQMVARERHFWYTAEAQSKSTWVNAECNRYRPLSTLTVGIMGLGSIGQYLCKTAKFFGMKVHGFRQNSDKPTKKDSSSANDEAKSLCDRIYGSSEMDAFLSSADYIVCILPSTDDTRGLLSNGRLKACASFKSKKPLGAEPKPLSVGKRADGVCLVNVGRGDVVDEASVVEALKQGWISTAILDVFSPEPLAASSALWSFPPHQVVITPHVSAATLGGDVAGVFSQNLDLLLAGKPLMYEVDIEKGY